MDSEQLQKIRVLLENMKQEIVSDVEQTISEMTDHQFNTPDITDRATLESDRSFELRLRSREQQLLDKINQAIARIDSGTYGICEECEEEIGVKRLEARPVATHCIDCKIKQEQRERNSGR
ncbi:RNA polymerase-binding protein DksA [Candidatus Electronema sp. PJ]|jgi:DnaK suppressor protein|uniref:RNA polymerase-binding protein DksA n=1 Tax=Candidatus Electronema sp. PJ TaxID=3401572 RepID=UPI003AA91676